MLNFKRINIFLLVGLFLFLGIGIGTSPLAYFYPKTKMAMKNAQHWRDKYDLAKLQKDLFALKTEQEFNKKLIAGLADIKAAREKDKQIISSISKKMKVRKSRKSKPMTIEFEKLKNESQALYDRGVNALYSPVLGKR